MTSYNNQIKKNISNIYRKAFIKRRSLTNGQFESTWYEITKYIKRWGRIQYAIDSVRTNKFKFNTISVMVDNSEGKFNPNTDVSSLWYGYAAQQRTLFKIETGFEEYTYSNNRWTLKEYPYSSNWDVAYWDQDNWDQTDGVETTFKGIISGDLPLTDKVELKLNIKPLTQVFVDYPAKGIDGFTSTGISSSDFINMLRDQTDGSNNYIFRPFFDNTTSQWNISTTTTLWPNLNGPNAIDIYDKTCWDVIEKLAQIENYVPFISSDGKFNFKPRTATTATVFNFYGHGYNDRTVGKTIININSIGDKITNFYSRVRVKYINSDTSTSYKITESAINVSNNSTSWLYGFRTLDVENFWVNSTTATNIADTLFNEFSSIKKEITFNTSFVPHINVLDRISVNYDSSFEDTTSLWNQNKWNTELKWYKYKGGAFIIEGKEFKVISVNIDLDNLKCQFVGTEL